MIDGIGYGGKRRDDRAFADAAQAVGMTGVRHFDNHRVNHRQVQAGGHPVVEETGVSHSTLGGVEILLVQGPADALHRGALDLSLDKVGMHRLAGVQKGGKAEDGDFAGIRIHFYIHDIAGKDGADAGRGRRGGTGNRAAGTHQAAGQFLESQLVLGFGADKSAVLKVHIVILHFPQEGGPAFHLGFDFLRGGDGGQAGVKGGAAAAGVGGVADAVGIPHRRDNIRGGQAQGFGGLHSNGGAGAANVHGTGNQVDGAVAVDIDGRRGGLAALGAEGYGHAAAAIRAAQRRGVVGMLEHRFLEFPAAKDGVGDAVGHPVALFNGVFQPQFHRVEAQFLSQFVQGAFHGKGGLGLARSAVGLGFLLVADHIVAVDQEMLQIVGAKAGDGAAADRRAGKSAGFIDHIKLAGGELTVFFGPEFDFHIGGGGRAAALENFLAAHGDFHRAAGFFRQGRRYRSQVSYALGPETAADFHRDDFDQGFRDAQDGGGRGPHRKSALSAGPDGKATVARPLGGGNMGFNVALMDGLGFVLPLDDYIGGGKTLFHIAEFVLQVAGDVAALAGVVAGAETLHPKAGRHIVVEQRGVSFQSLAPVQGHRQDFVVHLNQGQGFLSDMGIGGGDGGDGVAAIEGFAVGQDVFGDDAGVLLGVFVVDGRAFLDDGKVGGRGHGHYAGQGFGPGGVDAADAGVSVGAAEDFAVEHSGQVQVGAETGGPGYFVKTVVAGGTGADHAVFAGGGSGHQRPPYGLGQSDFAASLGIGAGSVKWGAVYIPRQIQYERELLTGKAPVSN